MSTRLHDDEIPIDVAIVRGQVDGQLPGYASRALCPLGASGSSNAMFRLGSDLLVRQPRQPSGSVSIEKEARWLPLIGSGLTVPVPRVLAVGEPDQSYPERWSVTTWLDGDPLTVMDGATAGEPRQALAHDLARLLGQMCELPVPPEALRDQSLSGYRGRPLSEVDLDFREAVDACRGLDGLELDLDAALGLWEQALQAESGAEPASGWYHGDLLAENLLVNDGRLAAVLDFGGLAVGDPSVDLMAGWEVLDRESRDSFRRAADVDDATWLKGVAWTLLIAVITFPYYWSTMPARCASRRVMAANVLAEL